MLLKASLWIGSSSPEFFIAKKFKSTLECKAFFLSFRIPYLGEESLGLDKICKQNYAVNFVFKGFLPTVEMTNREGNYFLQTLFVAIYQLLISLKRSFHNATVFASTDFISSAIV